MSVPFIFRNRQFSSSKLNLREHLLFAKQLLYFTCYRLFRRGRPSAGGGA